MANDRICIINDEHKCYVIIGDSYPGGHAANNNSLVNDLGAFFDDYPEFNSETSLRIAMESSIDPSYEIISETLR